MVEESPNVRCFRLPHWALRWFLQFGSGDQSIAGRNGPAALGNESRRHLACHSHIRWDTAVVPAVDTHHPHRVHGNTPNLMRLNPPHRPRTGDETRSGRSASRAHRSSDRSPVSCSDFFNPCRRYKQRAKIGWFSRAKSDRVGTVQCVVDGGGPYDLRPRPVTSRASHAVGADRDAIPRL
jgi:hypothetical protein